MNKLILKSLLLAMVALSQVVYANRVDELAESCDQLAVDADTEEPLTWRCKLKTTDEQYLDEACNSDDIKACFVLGSYLNIKYDHGSNKYYLKACSHNHVESCSWLARHYLLSRRDNAKAAELLFVRLFELSFFTLFDLRVA